MTRQVSKVVDLRLEAPARWLKPRSQAGQTVVMVALMIFLLLGMVALALDAGVAMYFNQRAERAASAGAVSGVLFMPNQFSPIVSQQDAVDRALAEVGRNGFTTGAPVLSGGKYVATNAAAGVTVTVAKTNVPNQLAVTVQKSMPTSFMQLFGISILTVSRTAVAGYLSPINLGQPGTQVGSTVTTLGNAATNSFYFLRSEGWGTPRTQGDSYTPNPATSIDGSLSTDVHSISQSNFSNEVSDPSLGYRGGYNYNVYLPAGGDVQVYNAAFAPENGPTITAGLPTGGENFCNSAWPLWATCNPVGNCSAQAAPQMWSCSPSASGNNYYLHEDDGSFAWPGTIASLDPTEFSAMRYTVFKVNNVFDRTADTMLSQVTVYPLVASNWNANWFMDVKSGAKFQITAACSGASAGLDVYHNWISVVNPNACDAKNDPSLVVWNKSQAGSLPAGTYRLRVDHLNYDGSLQPDGNGGGVTLGNSSKAHKAIAVRVTGGGGCAGCAIGGWNDLGIYTPVSGTNFTMPIFELPPSYKGETIDVDVYDPGDINANGGSAYLAVLDPLGVQAKTVTMTDLGASEKDPPASPPTCTWGSDHATNAPCSIPSSGAPCINAGCVVTNQAGTDHFNGQWVRYEVQIDANYDTELSGAGFNSPNQWYWSLNYLTTATVQATDTITVTVGLRGAPAHLLSS